MIKLIYLIFLISFLDGTVCQMIVTIARQIKHLSHSKGVMSSEICYPISLWIGTNIDDNFNKSFFDLENMIEIMS